MNKRNRIIITGLIIALFLGTAGCNSPKNLTYVNPNKGMHQLADPMKKNITVAFSDYSKGNMHHVEIEALFKNAANSLKNSGEIADYLMVDATQNTNQQISQISGLISKHVSAIVIDPSSPTALNGVITTAMNAGIRVVVVHSGPVTNNDCYQICDDLSGIASAKATYIVNRLGGMGNIIIMRGINGTQSDKIMYQSMMNIFNKYPKIKVEATVFANLNRTTAQKQVSNLISGLPKIDAVIGEGGDDDIGAVWAFQKAKRPVPLITGENDGYFLNWWAGKAKSNNYQTMSSSFNPWSAAAGLYVATDILNGKTVSHTMIIPSFAITQSNLSKYSRTPQKAIAFMIYDHNWVVENLENQMI